MDGDEFEWSIFYRKAYRLSLSRLEESATLRSDRNEAAIIARIIRDIYHDGGETMGSNVEAMSRGVRDAVMGFPPEWRA